MVMVQNDQLAYLTNQSEQYFKTHGITFDKLTLPDLQLDTPLFSYFFPRDMQQNELVL
jgi:hypothetical protein